MNNTNGERKVSVANWNNGDEDTSPPPPTHVIKRNTNSESHTSVSSQSGRAGDAFAPSSQRRRRW